MVGTHNAFSVRYLYIFFWCDYVVLYMVGTLNAFLARYLYTFLVWLRWVVYGWHSQCIFGEVFVYFFGVITLGCIWLALSMHFRLGICILFWCDYVGLYMVGTHRHFRWGICILFWCDYVVLYMVGTLNAFPARYSYTFFGVIMLCCIWLALSMHFRRGICILFWCDYVVLYMVGTLNAFSARYLYTFLVWLRWVVYGWHSQCIFGEVFVYFFGVITLGCIWLALSMHFWRGICILFWCDYVGLYMVGTLNAFSARYLYTFLVWLRWVVYGWHSQCIFGEVFVYFFGVITLCCIWLALSMHFWRGICILFWCDYVGLYMVGTLNAFSARYLYTFLVWLRWVVYGWHSQCIFGEVFVYFFWCDYVGLYMVGTHNAFSARYLYTFLVWLRWVVYGWHSQCIFGEVFVYFFGVITLGCIWLALSMHFWWGICILFWCDYVGLYMVGTLNAFSALRGICILFWCDYVVPTIYNPTLYMVGTHPNAFS